ncbi:MAG: ABC transporter ATP-binding protein, partial [Alphaproteobacteria bacterium]|nr:ABC transporter ATP-binding protein [Alphaproteobacteria bacterium]
IKINDRLVNGVRASDRDLAMVFQSYALYPHLTVQENMLTPLRLRNLSTLQRFPFVGRFLSSTRRAQVAMDRAVQDTAETLKIQPLLSRKPGQLSGGQRQRAALGRAMVRRPVAFLMDEPLSNLDAALRVHMRAELTELHRRLKTTFVYVTHDQAEAMTMSSRVAVMMDGHILQLDTPAVIYSKPATIQVAEFIGSPKINILNGYIDSMGMVSIMGVQLDEQFDAQEQAVKIGVRPEHLTVLPGRKAQDRVLVGTVRHVENFGSDLFIHASLADGRDQIVVRTAGDLGLSLGLGDTVYIGFKPATAHIFDAVGKRLSPSVPVTATSSREVA